MYGWQLLCSWSIYEQVIKDVFHTDLKSFIWLLYNAADTPRFQHIFFPYLMFIFITFALITSAAWWSMCFIYRIYLQSVYNDNCWKMCKYKNKFNDQSFKHQWWSWINDQKNQPIHPSIKCFEYQANHVKSKINRKNIEFSY